ncbi:hypothetical protein F750_1286 [Streptomyces sp. PAMC 26508]|nr:hypothetical protein F750_1286 [Streptomyces sp. PAMC 26508]
MHGRAGAAAAASATPAVLRAFHPGRTPSIRRARRHRTSGRSGGTGCPAGAGHGS